MARHRERYPPESIHDAIRESDPTPQDCRRCEDPAAVSLRHYPVSRSAQAGSSNRSAPPTRPMPRVAIVTLGGMQPIGFGCVGPTDSPRTTRPPAREYDGPPNGWRCYSRPPASGTAMAVAAIAPESSGAGSRQTSEIYRSDASGRSGDIRRCSSIQD